MKAPRNSRLALIKRRHRRDLWFTAFAAMMVNSDIDCVMGMEPTEVGHRTANRIPLLEAADPVTVVPLTKLREWRPRIRTSAMRNQPPIGALEGKRAPVKLSDDEKHSRWLDCMQRIAEAPPRPPAKPRRQVSQWHSQPRTGELAKSSTRPPAGATDNRPPRLLHPAHRRRGADLPDARAGPRGRPPDGRGVRWHLRRFDWGWSQGGQ